MGLVGRDGTALPLQLEGENAPRGLETVLVLDQAQAHYTFTGVTQEPVPSLMRGLSAPVVLEVNLIVPLIP